MAAVLAPLAVPSAALAERWLRPVPGEVARPFSYSSDTPFARGAHRGADLAAPPGTPVRAACGGRVIHAGAVAGRENVVSIRCGGRRVSYLPLATLAVRAGATIRPGAPIGTVAPGHGGLHVGIRREGDPFGYEDPMALLPAPGHPFTPAPRPAARRAPPRIAPRPSTPAARPATMPRPLAGRPPSSLAPWPVWVGLAALLSGAAGSGTIAARRRLVRRRARAASPIEVG
jgi:murein DD-endopeptidase MepM/ murein hydrolase activator NlpD